MRKAFTSHATYVVTRLPGLQSRSQIARYLILLFSFLIAALLHILASDRPFRCSIWPQLRYYTSTALAIVLEDFVIAVGLRVKNGFRRKEVTAKVDLKNGDSPSEVASSIGNEYLSSYEIHAPLSEHWRIIGYCWVAAFDMWATSKLVYASAICR